MADAATPQASALEQPRFWTLDRVADALGDGPRGPTALVRIATDTRSVGTGDLWRELKAAREEGLGAKKRSLNPSLGRVF